MRINRVLWLPSLFALSQIAIAESSLPSAVLGQLEGIVNYCAEADSKLADQYKERGKLVVSGMTDKELSEARQSAEYKDSYDATTGELKKLPADKAVENCRASLQSEKQ